MLDGLVVTSINVDFFSMQQGPRNDKRKDQTTGMSGDATPNNARENRARTPNRQRTPKPKITINKVGLKRKQNRQATVPVFSNTEADQLIDRTIGWFIFQLCPCFLHDDIMAWRRILHHWFSVKGIHQSTMDSFHKGPVKRSSAFFFAINPNNLLNKQWIRQWIQTQWRSCDVTVSELQDTPLSQ